MANSRSAKWIASYAI